MEQGGDTFLLGSLQHRAAGIAAHADSDIGFEVFQNLLRQANALPEFEQHLHVAQQVLAVEAAHWQPLDFVASGWHTLHFHASFRTHEQDFSLRVSAANFIGY